MKRIYVPSRGCTDWEALLAQDGQWRTGCSAKTLACCWENADGLPLEIDSTLRKAGFDDVEPLFIVPEHRVPLKGGGRPSQSDLFILAKTQGQLMAITVEGKVAEPFGEMMSDWRANASPGKQERLRYLLSTLELEGDAPDHLRYQLLHRAASAVLEAERFCAKYALMLVHSFSTENRWFADFSRFMNLFDRNAVFNELIFAAQIRGVEFYCGWIKGNPKYLECSYEHAEADCPINRGSDQP